VTDDSFSKSSDLPQIFSRRGFYYGWIVLFAGTVGIIMSVPGQTMGVSIYTDPLLTSLHLSRVDLSMAYMLGTFGSALLLPFVGRLLDTIGSRAVAVFAALGLAFWLVFLSFSPSISAKFASSAHLSPRWAGAIVAFVGFLGIRHFGQGELTIASRTMMGRWFERRRGLVLGVSGFFVAFGFGVAPLVLNRLILRFGWQRSLEVLALGSCGMAFFAWAIFRKSPEACGLEIDGKSVVENIQAGIEYEVSFTAEEARRTIAFWAFNLGMAAHAMLYTAITFHMERIAQLNHMSNAKAFSVFLPVAIVSTSADLTGGVISDWIPMKYLLLVMQLGLCLGLLGARSYGTAHGFLLTAIGFGLGNGLFSLLSSAAWPKLFGREHLGAISGFNMSWVVAGSAVGPYLFSLGDSWTGSYRSILLFSLIIPVGILIASFFATAPTRERVIQEVSI
jgi:MFS family permease